MTCLALNRVQSLIVRLKAIKILVISLRLIVISRHRKEKKSIKLTEKENDIFKLMLLSPDYKVKKELLLKNIWKYHENSESSTVDTHLYKLKLKLPSEMLQLKNNICKLNIKTLH